MAAEPGASEDTSHFGKVKLVVYDFDQTITHEHLYHVLGGGDEADLGLMKDERLIKVFGGAERIKRLSAHFERVTKKAEIAIISYGYVPVIRSALHRVGLGDFFPASTPVVGSDSALLKKVGGNKFRLVAAWCSEKALSSTEACFVDDDPFNVKQATTSGTCLGVTITPREGMSEAHMTRIEMYSGGHPSQTKKRPSITVTTPKGTESLADRFKVTIPDRFKKVFDPESDDDGTPVIDIEHYSPSGSKEDFEIAMPPLGAAISTE